MQDLTLTLALCNGRETALIQAKEGADQFVAKLAYLQSANAAEKAAAIASLKGAAGVRVTSPVDDGSNAERTAGQYAIVKAVKGGNVAMTEDEAKKTWREAALASRPADRPWLLCDPDGLIQEYQANLGLKSWEEFRTWLIQTPIEQMGI